MMRNYYNIYGFPAFMLVIIILFLLVIVLVKDTVNRRKRNRQLAEEMEQPVLLPEVNGVYAVITAKDVVMEKGYFPDSPYRTHRLNYILSFLMDEGDTVSYNVPSELYEYVYTGQKGILATIDGEFFDFGSGEDIE